MSELAGRRIALIGGAGFIGHNMAIRLKNLGAEVFVIDSLSVNNYAYFLDRHCEHPNPDLALRFIHQRLDLLREYNIPLFVRDARDYHKLCDVMSQVDPDTIIHLAAVAHANKSNKDPYSTFDHSLRTLENALDNARSQALNIQHFIYFSSSMVYGHFPSGFVTEDTPCNPIGIYGALKLAGEHIVRAYGRVFDLPYTIVRPSALYGPRCVSRRVAQIFIENAIQGKEIEMHGDGSDRLDFTCVQDLVNGIVCCLKSERAKGETFNLTYGESRSISQLAGILKEHFPGIRITYHPKDQLTPDRGTLCVDKACDLIGYNPQYPLERGYVEYINWYKSIQVQEEPAGRSGISRVPAVPSIPV